MSHPVLALQIVRSTFNSTITLPTAMAPPGFDDVSIFDEVEVSSTVSANDAPEFFERYGVFYQASAEVGRSASSLAQRAVSNDDLNNLKPIFRKDDVSSFARRESVEPLLTSSSVFNP